LDLSLQYSQFLDHSYYLEVLLFTIKSEAVY
jgi:hypothetical protein